MALHSLADNVIALDPHARRSARRIAPDKASVINDCRDLAVKRICEVVAKAFDRIEEELFEMAEKSADRELQGVYLDARAQAREKRVGIEQAFRLRFVGEFDGKVRGDAVKAPVPGAGLELSLVEDADLEESIAMSNMANNMKSSSEEELQALSQRMGFLLHDPELADGANPMSPETVCSALKEACSQITAGYRVKLTILRLFEQHVAKDLVDVYRAVNTHLVERHHVMPEIRTTYRKPVSSPNRPTAQAPAATAASAPAAGKAPDGGDVFAMLQQLMGGAGRGGAQGAAGLPGDMGAMMAGAGMAGAGMTQGGFMPAGAMPGAAPVAMATAQLLGSLSTFKVEPAAMPQQFDAASLQGVDLAQALNVLREVSARGLASGASQVDSMTIDIVAMLFDYVFNDREIPAPIKALLAKLQIPVLKAALLDKRFFSQKAHPARVLLDGLAELALQCDEDVDAGHAVYQFIDELVSRVQNGFETDLTLFSDEVAKLAAFVAAREQNAESFVEQSARLVQDREQREIARLVSENAIAERLSGKTLAPAVVVMLKARWVDVLKAAYLVSGEDSAPWATALRVVDDLLWSLEPKSGPEDRKRLVALLPDLLRKLQQGMAGIEMEQHERERFFSALVAHHAAAVKAGLRQGDTDAAVPQLEVVDASQVEVPAPQEEEQVELDPGQPGLMRIHLEADGVRVEELHMTAPARAEPLQPIPHKLQRGTWVEFRRGVGKAVRAKLSWISPHKGVMLFTNPESSSAISLTPEVFAGQLRDGLVRIFAEEALVDRAVDSVMNELRAA